MGDQGNFDLLRGLETQCGLRRGQVQADFCNKEVPAAIYPFFCSRGLIMAWTPAAVLKGRLRLMGIG